MNPVGVVGHSERFLGQCLQLSLQGIAQLVESALICLGATWIRLLFAVAQIFGYLVHLPVQFFNGLENGVRPMPC